MKTAAIAVASIGILSGCAGTVVHTTAFSPAPDKNPPGVYRARRVFTENNPAPKIGSRQVADTAAVVLGPDIAFTLMLNRFDNIYDLVVMIENPRDSDVTITPAMFRLFEGNRVALRPLRTDEAANSFLARLGSYHPFPPKYVSTTTASVGFDGSVRATTVTQQDPVDQMTGFLVAASIDKKNDQLRAIASMLYSGGMGQSETVPGRSKIARDVYFAAELPWPADDERAIAIVSFPFYGRKELIFRSH